MSQASPSQSDDNVLAIPGFRRFLVGNVLALLGLQMQNFTVSWELYERTRQPLNLGLIGLAQVIPVLALAIPAGQLMDRIDRRLVLVGALLTLMLCSASLAIISLIQADVSWIYACLVLNGAARAFQQPAKASLLPQLVPREAFARAVTWNTACFQISATAGPFLASFMIWLTGRPDWVYLLDAVLAAGFISTLLSLRPQVVVVARERVTWRSLLGGIEYVWRTKLILGAISLDMFAVLLGGSVALLPVFAKDVLHTQESGLGLMAAAPGVGAILMSLVLAHLPPIRRAGHTLLISVGGFGVATIVFGLTRNLWVATAMLFLSGALDMISVIIRHTLVQLRTPDSMRGRVSAVNSVFISVSNELGSFESGMVAHLFRRAGDPAFGPTCSVVFGGMGTLLVVLVTALCFPRLRRFGRLDDGMGPDGGESGRERDAG